MDTAPKDTGVPGEENKEAAVLLEKPKTEDAAAALKSGAFGEPCGASAMEAALPAFDERLPFAARR